MKVEGGSVHISLRGIFLNRDQINIQWKFWRKERKLIKAEEKAVNIKQHVNRNEREPRVAKTGIRERTSKKNIKITPEKTKKNKNTVHRSTATHPLINESKLQFNFHRKNCISDEFGYLKKKDVVSFRKKTSM